MKKLTLYKNSKPYTRWWWFNIPIKEEDIRFQLDWLKQNNFGGVEMAFVYPLEDQPAGPEWLSPEWSQAVAFAKKYCDKIGLGCDFSFGTLWPFGGTFVEDKYRSKVFGGLSEQQLTRSWEKNSGKPSYLINHLSKKALEFYAAKMGAGLKEALNSGKPSALFCDSWEVETENLWTDGFDKSFQRKFGYDINEYMGAQTQAQEPAQTEPATEASPTDEKHEKPKNLDSHPEVRYDYRKLIAEYTLNEFYKPYTQICNKLRSFSRVQCHGSPTDLLATYGAVDVPESEAILFDPDFSLIPASAAALAEKQIVTCETFTCLYGWKTYPGPGPHQKQEQTADMKLLADALFANGINHIFWHGMPFNPEKGKNQFYASTHVGPDSPYAPEIPEFNRYMEKVCDAMKQGRTYSDVAVYLPLEDNWVRNKLPSEQLKPSAAYHWEMHYVKPPVELQCYHPLWISSYYLKRAKFKKGVLRCGNAAFTSLYINVRWMDKEALKIIIKLARKGLPICLKQRPNEPGKGKSREYGRLVSQLTRLKKVSFNFRKIAINPPLVLGTDLPDFWCRTVGKEKYIFFAHPKAQNLKYPLSYGQSLNRERIEKTVAINVGKEFKYTNLVFEPYQSILLKITKTGAITPIDISFVPRTPKTARNKEEQLPEPALKDAIPAETASQGREGETGTITEVV